MVSRLGDAWGMLRVGVISGDSVERMRAMEKGRTGVGIGGGPSNLCPVSIIAG